MNAYLIPTAALVACVSGTCFGAPQALSISQGNELVWSTAVGNTYQPQVSPTGDTWTNLGPELPGNGGVQTLFSGEPDLFYQILEIVPGAPGGPVTTNAAVNGGFESGDGDAADHWSAVSSQAPVRTGADAHLGSFSVRGRIVNAGAEPGEGLLVQRLVPQGSSVTAGKTYVFSFWSKQISAGPSYVQQYEMQWLDGGGAVIGSTGLQTFSGTIGQWEKISVPDLIAPTGAVDARISFRFVTGAVPDGAGEVLIDDVALESTGDSGPPGPPEIKPHPFTMRRAVNLSWPTVAGTDYQARWSPDLAPGSWSDLAPKVTGDGNPRSLLVPMTMERQFFRVESPVLPLLSPTDVRVEHAGSANAIGLAWTASASPGITGYRILFGPSPAGLTESLDVGNVTSAVIPGLSPGQTYFIAVVALGAGGQSPVGTVTLSAQPEADSGIVALYNTSTVLEAPTSVVTPSALITRIADRARDRHAREDMFHSYDHYLSWYWEQRIANLEIIDRVGRNGGT
ncbi:MAG: fibronectin type III domain-containing protein, partial [Verrucomicrobiae bacterium]|nr:fibronectin type III domain-containing protein [Verrucomicrobiae bacterium]